MKLIEKVERRGTMVYTCEDLPGKAECIAELNTIQEATELANAINLINSKINLKVVDSTYFER